VPEPKRAKNRMHIDVRVAGEPPWDMAQRANLIRAKVRQVAAAGAARRRRGAHRAAVSAGGRVVDDENALSFVVLADPDGNQACVCTCLDN